MKIASIVLNEFYGEIQGDVFGVDLGAWFCLENNIPMKAACGDFDSVNDSQREAVFSMDIPIYKLPKEKNLTDFDFALSLCDDYEEIYVFGALGGRRDHEYLNLALLIRDKRITFINKQNRIRAIEKGEYTIKKDTFQYLSFIPLQSSKITLDQVKYPLHERLVDQDDRYLTSNEILQEAAQVIVHEGSFLMIQSKDA